MNKVILAVIIALFISFFAIWRHAQNHGGQTTPLAENTLLVGTNAEYPPFTFIQDGTIVGFDIDLIKAIAQKLGKEVILKDMPFEALLPELQMGSLPVVAAGLTATPERAEHILFTKAYIKKDPLVVVTRAKSPISSLADLNNKDVVVNEGYTADYYMSSLKGPQILRLASPADALMALNSDRAFAFVAARSALVPLFEQFDKTAFATFVIADAFDSYSLAVSPYHTTLYQQIEKALEDLEQEGTLDELQEKWHLL